MTPDRLEVRRCWVTGTKGSVPDSGRDPRASVRPALGVAGWSFWRRVPIDARRRPGFFRGEPNVPGWSVPQAAASNDTIATSKTRAARL